MRRESHFNLGHDASARVTPATSLKTAVLGGYLKPPPFNERAPQSTHTAHLFVIYPFLTAPLLPSGSTHYLLTSSRLSSPASVLGHFGGESRSGVVLFERAAALKVPTNKSNYKQNCLTWPVNFFWHFTPSLLATLWQGESNRSGCSHDLAIGSVALTKHTLNLCIKFKILYSFLRKKLKIIE